MSSTFATRVFPLASSERRYRHVMVPIRPLRRRPVQDFSPYDVGKGCRVHRPSGLKCPSGLENQRHRTCLLYTSDAADEEDSVDLGGRRIIKKKKKKQTKQ